MEGNKNEPFFCYVPYNAPHHPFQLPDRYFQKYKDRGLSDEVSAIYGMVENIDDNVGKLLDYLDEQNLSENTIVIFLSDNGPSMPRPGVGEGPRFNGGMRGRKAEVDEGSVRVPFFIRWPGRIRPATEVSIIAAHIDIFPTLLDLCELSPPEAVSIDGRSLAPLFEQTTDSVEDEWPDRLIFTHQNVFGDNRMFPGGVRTQRYRLTNRGKGYELYDMISDPGQTENVADDHPEVLQRLSREYEDWYEQVTAAGIEAPPLPIGFSSSEIVALQAEDSSLKGGLQFWRKIGWAHDTVTQWRNPEASVTWELDVLQEGQYEVTLMYSCPEGETGSQIEITVGERRLKSKITEAYDPRPPTERELDHKRLETSGPVWFRTYAPLAFPAVSLQKGRTQLTVRATDIPGEEAFVLKEARVRLLD